MSHENWARPCLRRALPRSVFERVVESVRAFRRPAPQAGAHKGLVARGEWRLVANLFEALDPDQMTDTGMYVWAVILTIVGLAASYAIAVGWQRWKEKRKEA